MAEGDILDMRSIEKSFSGIPVLRKVAFSLRRGEVHALMGGNGAGKSTLMKILTGVYTRDAGTVEIDGREVDFSGPPEAERAGVAMIFQEFSLIPTLTVAQNIFLAREPRRGRAFLDDAEAMRRARAVLSELGENIDPRIPVERLSVGHCQMVEIAKALAKDARILVMDEPTASLSESETEALFRLVARLKASGISIVYISHRMAEVFRICDRITVMRDGETVLTDAAANLTMDGLVEAMLGGAGIGAGLQWRERQHALGAAPVLEVENLSVGDHVVDVSFRVYPGEVVGLAGLMGSGRTEIAEGVFGVRRREAGSVRVGGRPVRGIAEAIRAGVGLVPENRRTQGLVLDHSLLHNHILPNLRRFTRGFVLDEGAAAKAARGFIARLKIKTDRPGKVARLLSGGNQQKIVLSKWLERRPKLLILDEPTIGVDIGAKSDIAEIVRELAAGGAAVLLISSEFEELLAMSDRLLVVHDGRLTREIDRRDIASEETLHHAVQG